MPENKNHIQTDDQNTNLVLWLAEIKRSFYRIVSKIRTLSWNSCLAEPTKTQINSGWNWIIKYRKCLRKNTVCTYMYLTQNLFYFYQFELNLSQHLDNSKLNFVLKKKKKTSGNQFAEQTMHHGKKLQFHTRIFNYWFLKLSHFFRLFSQKPETNI